MLLASLPPLALMSMHPLIPCHPPSLPASVSFTYKIVFSRFPTLDVATHPSLTCFPGNQQIPTLQRTNQPKVHVSPIPQNRESGVIVAQHSLCVPFPAAFIDLHRI